MSTLPTLPGCGQPATIQIEIYSAANGVLHGSLDGSVYACDLHGIEAVSAIQAAGFTAYRMPGGDAKRCGDGMDFTGPTARPFTAPTTPEAAAVPEMQHPRWCDRKTCERLRGHWSTVRHVDTGREEETVLDAALVQSWHPAAKPQISLTVIDGISVDQLLLSLDQARALSYRLRQLLDAAKGGQR